MSESGALKESFVLRSMVAADLPEIMCLEKELFGADAWSQASLAGELARPDRIYRVAQSKTDDAVVAYAGMWLGDPLQVMTVGVAPGMQGKGLGRAMMNDLLKLCQEVVKKFAPADQQNPEVMLEVRQSNTVAQHLYTRLGFGHIGVRKAYYRNEDAIVMSRKLNPEGNSHE